MAFLSKKKSQSFKGAEVSKILKTAANKRIVAKVRSRSTAFECRFLELTETSVLLDNTLSNLEEVRLLRNRDLDLFFPFRNTLLRGKIRLTGLATIHNIRALRFSLPPNLSTDEKRGVKRVRNLPPNCHMTFHTPSFSFYHGRLVDASPTGLAMIFDEPPNQSDVQIGESYQAEATLGEDLKLSFEAEIRHIAGQGKEIRAGVRIIKLRAQAQERLNEWIFRLSSLELEEPDPTDEPGVETQTADAKSAVKESPGSILVIAPQDVDLDFWYNCLGRKYEVITCDDNVANIRDSLNVKPSLLLVFLDSRNADKASFMRKFCTTLGGRTLMFFGVESDKEAQKRLMGGVSNRGFLDMSERQMLLKFRAVDRVMQELGGN